MTTENPERIGKRDPVDKPATKPDEATTRRPSIRDQLAYFRRAEWSPGHRDDDG